MNQLESNGLFRNRGGWQFENVTTRHPALALDDRVCVGGAMADFDNDGDQDIYVTSTRGGNTLLENRGGQFVDITTSEFHQNDGYYEGPDILWQFVRSSRDLETNRLFRNNGNRTFTDVSERAGLKGQGWSSDVSAFDFDEDGDLDLFVANMFGLSQLYANDGGGHFDDVTGWAWTKRGLLI